MKVTYKSNGKDISGRKMLCLLEPERNLLNNYIVNTYGAYTKIKTETGIHQDTIKEGMKRNCLFEVPVLLKLRDFIKTLPT